MRLCIDPGHGGKDPGAVFRGTLEKDITLAIARALQKLLAPSVIETRLTRESDVSLGISARAALSNAWNASAFLSIHCNADLDPDEPGMPEARGGEAFYTSDAGAVLAQRVSVGMWQEFPVEPWRGIKHTSKLGVLNLTHCPAVLVEVAFIDRSESERMLKNPDVQARIAFALLRAVLQWEIHL